MQVILAAMGGGAPGTMTAECAGALAAAECVVGARRLLAGLPAPDVVFIGGTGGGMAGVVDAALARSPSARICISAIALETLAAAAAALTAHGLAAQVTQIAVSRTRPAGGLHLLMANNPVFLVTGNCE